jgi:predicted DNA-binding transcriptional regulator YafY
MTRASNTAEAQLERILYILPAAARGRVPVDEIARALDVEPATVLRDLEDATARSYYHPAGSVESFSITTDGRTVQVHAPTEFTRPVRLSQGEAMALGLGLRALAADADVERRTGILNLAQRLEAALVAPDVLAREAAPRYVTASDASLAAEDEVEYEAMELAFDDDGFRGVVADAVELRRLCTIWYLKPGDTAPVQRTIAPFRLIYAYGRWYVLAHDMDRDGLRFFRMDRILDARLDEAAAPEPPELDDLLERGVPYSAREEVEVTVRYSPRIARWIAERMAQPLERDGSAVVRHRVADPGWIVRHVLQYAGDAVVEEPEEARGWMASAAAVVRDGRSSSRP